METLKIVIKKQWFDQIANGTKKIEYRDVTPSGKAAYSTRTANEGNMIVLSS